MSTHVTARVWKRSRSKGSARLVLLYLADIADEYGYCWPKVDTIAAAANISERQARAAIAALEADGEVGLIAGQGRGHMSVYAVLAGLDPHECAAVLAGLEGKAEEIALALRARRERKVQSSHLSYPKRVQSSHPLETEKVQFPQEKVQSAQIKGAIEIDGLPAPTPEHTLIHHEIRHDPPPPEPPTPSAGGGGEEFPESRKLLRAAGVKSIAKVRALATVAPDVVARTVAGCKQIPGGKDLGALVVSYLEEYQRTGEELNPARAPRPLAPPPLPDAPAVPAERRLAILAEARRHRGSPP